MTAGRKFHSAVTTTGAGPARSATVMGIFELVAASRRMTGPAPPPPSASGATAGSSCDSAPGTRAPATASCTERRMKSRRDSRDSFFGSAWSVMQLDPLVLPLAEPLLRDGDVVHEEALVEEDDAEQAEEDAS